MDYQEKYLKYKTKYLHLKNIVGGGFLNPQIENRVQIEIKRLKDLDLFDDFNYDKENNRITFIRKSDGCIIRIILPQNYPFDKPTITYNNRNLNIDLWGVGKNLKTFVLSIQDNLERKNQILIMCHPHKIETHGHWLLDSDIKPLIEKERIDNYEFITGDIISGGDIQDDLFSDGFINQNIENFNAVIIPDCAGFWYTLQKSRESIYCDKLYLLIKKIMNTIKNNGVLFISKFLYDEFYNYVKDNLVREGIIFEETTLNFSKVTKVLIIRKL